MVNTMQITKESNHGSELRHNLWLKPTKTCLLVGVYKSRDDQSRASSFFVIVMSYNGIKEGGGGNRDREETRR